MPQSTHSPSDRPEAISEVSTPAGVTEKREWRAPRVTETGFEVTQGTTGSALTDSGLYS